MLRDFDIGHLISIIPSAMPTVFPWARSLRKLLDKLHTSFETHRLGLPVTILLTEETFDRLKASLIEVDASSVQGLSGRPRARHLVVTGVDGVEFMQYRGFKFMRGESVRAPANRLCDNVPLVLEGSSENDKIEPDEGTT